MCIRDSIHAYRMCAQIMERDAEYAQQVRDIRALALEGAPVPEREIFAPIEIKPKRPPLPELDEMDEISIKVAALYRQRRAA